MATKPKSTVNAAGNYTKPTMRKALFEKIKAGTKGGQPNEWSARRAKREATKAGKQFAKQPKKVSEKIKGFR